MPFVAVHVTTSPAEADDRTDARRGGADVVTLAGRVPEALAAFAAPGDVLVLGTGKTGYVHGRVSGFTSVQIAGRAPSAVAIIPDIDLRFRSGVVAAVDEPETAVDIARAAAREAARRGEPVQVLHARDPRRSPDGAAAVRLAEEAIRREWPRLTVRTRVAVQPAPDALLDAARSASLLVLGRGAGDAGPRDGSQLGRVTLAVLLNANAPVLMVRGVTS
jgi:nucleotide-binding universal stress UspA family protein